MGNTGVIDCYKLLLAKAEDLVADWCIIATTKHYLVMD